MCLFCVLFFKKSIGWRHPHGESCRDLYSTPRSKQNHKTNKYILCLEVNIFGFPKAKTINNNNKNSANCYYFFSVSWFFTVLWQLLSSLMTWGQTPSLRRPVAPWCFSETCLKDGGWTGCMSGDEGPLGCGEMSLICAVVATDREVCGLGRITHNQQSETEETDLSPRPYWRRHCCY